MAIKQFTLSCLIFLIFASTIVLARDCSSDVYLINFFYDENLKLNFEQAYPGTGCYPLSTDAYSTLFEIKKDGQAYYTTSFDYKIIYTDVLDGAVIVGGAKKAHKTKFTLVVPYRQDIDGFEIKEGENTILSVNKTAFYNSNKKEATNQGLFDWVENLLKSTLGSLFS